MAQLPFKGLPSMHMVFMFVMLCCFERADQRAKLTVGNAISRLNFRLESSLATHTLGTARSCEARAKSPCHRSEPTCGGISLSTAVPLHRSELVLPHRLTPWCSIRLDSVYCSANAWERGAGFAVTELPQCRDSC